MATRTPTDSTVDLNPFRQLTTTFEQFKLPGVDTTAFVESRRKDVEALVAANTVTYEALQALARAQTDMLTQAMQGVQASAQGKLNGGAAAGNMAQQGEAAQQAWQQMLVDMKHLAEMAQKAQVQAMKGLSERASASVQELSALTRAK